MFKKLTREKLEDKELKETKGGGNGFFPPIMDCALDCAQYCDGEPFVAQWTFEHGFVEQT